MTSAAGVHVIFTTGRPFSIHQAAKPRIAKANQDTNMLLVAHARRDRKLAVPSFKQHTLKPRSAAVRSRCASSARPTPALRAERMMYMRRTLTVARFGRDRSTLQILGDRCVLPEL